MLNNQHHEKRSAGSSNSYRDSCSSCCRNTAFFQQKSRNGDWSRRARVIPASNMRRYNCDSRQSLLQKPAMAASISRRIKYKMRRDPYPRPTHWTKFTDKNTKLQSNFRILHKQRLHLQHRLQIITTKGF